MSAQPSDTKAIPKPEAPKQADPSEKTLDAGRLREISAHWNSVKNPRLQPGGYHRGIYIPPNGPPGKFYIGYGRVEIGLNSQGNTYVWVVPPAREEPKWAPLWHFFDPTAQKRQHIASQHQPRIAGNHYLPFGLQFGYLWWPTTTTGEEEAGWSEFDEATRQKKPVSVGDEGVGRYFSYSRQIYEGLGRVIQDEDPESGVRRKSRLVDIVPIPGRQARGAYRFFNVESDAEIPYMDLPGVVELMPTQKKRWRRKVRNRNPGCSPGFEEKTGPSPSPRVGDRGSWRVPGTRRAVGGGAR
ncbi:hypothetical protein BJX62DRAFT_245730 [Aspergillus germanicus]